MASGMIIGGNGNGKALSLAVARSNDDSRTVLRYLATCEWCAADGQCAFIQERADTDNDPVHDMQCKPSNTPQKSGND